MSLLKTRPRFSVRRLMVAVAFLAISIWSAMMIIRSLGYRRLAIHHEEICSVLASEIDSLTQQAEEAKLKGVPTLNLLTNVNESWIALVEEERIVEVYRRRIWRPWQKIR